MKKQLKIWFVDPEVGDDFRSQLIFRAIAKNYEIVKTNRNPEYVISLGLGLGHVKYHDCIKILWTGENYTPDFNWFDYAIGFDHLAFGDRYLRVPLYVFYTEDVKRVLNREVEKKTDEDLLNRGFCSFVVSNGVGDPMRRKFFERLSKYKKVDSGGRYLNNVGGPIGDKRSFCEGYKFNIAFENSLSSGYVTEKILQAYSATSVPVYYGDSCVFSEFNEKSMIYLNGEEDIERAVENIIRLDGDDSLYLDVVRAPNLLPGLAEMYEKNLEDFFVHIFEQDIDSARRRNRYGYQTVQAHRLAPILYNYQRMKDTMWRSLRFLHLS